MLSARESSVSLLDFGLVDSGFNSPDPDDRRVSNGAAVQYAVRKNSFRLSAYQFTKRVIDLTVAGTLLLVLSPVLLIVAALVRVTSKGPVIYSQERLTEGGRVFRMLKFRSMRADAEASGPVWAEEEDPRVTPIGKFLRLSHIDELPQLLNVLRGDMALIGPRPERPELTAELEAVFPNFRRRLDVKGGITGLAQVSSGYASNVQTYRDKLAHDLVYVRNCSLLLDLSIALKTILVVLTGDDGAR